MNRTDTAELRTAFIEKFISTEGIDVYECGMEDLATLFNEEIAHAMKLGLSKSDADQEFDNAAAWLDAQGYVGE